MECRPALQPRAESQTRRVRGGGGEGKPLSLSDERDRGPREGLLPALYSVTFISTSFTLSPTCHPTSYCQSTRSTANLTPANSSLEDSTPLPNSCTIVVTAHLCFQLIQLPTRSTSPPPKVSSAFPFAISSSPTSSVTRKRMSKDF